VGLRQRRRRRAQIARREILRSLIALEWGRILTEHNLMARAIVIDGVTVYRDALPHDYGINPLSEVTSVIRWLADPSTGSAAGAP
jgi:hypothetical protein